VKGGDHFPREKQSELYGTVFSVNYRIFARIPDNPGGFSRYFPTTDKLPVEADFTGSQGILSIR
jgi:hypothetical protein